MKKRLGYLLGATLLLGALGIVLYYIFGPGEGYFHADCTDSLYWANASLESGSVFDETYRYAALLPFSGCLWMIPLISIFGFGLTAHNIAMAIFAVVFVASVYFVVRSVGASFFASSLTAFITTLCLSSSDKLREIMWGHTIYYSVAVVSVLLGVGLCLRLFNALTQNKKTPAVLYAVALLFLSVGIATDGFQLVAIATLPLLVAVLGTALLEGKNKLLSHVSIRRLPSLIIIAVGTLLGLFLLKIWTKNGAISAGYADAYSGWSSLDKWSSNALAFVKQYFSLLGVSVEGLTTLFSKEALPVLLKIGMGVVILLAPVVMLFKYRLLRDGTKAILLAHFTLSCAVLFGWICGKLSGANWRLVPLVGTALVTSCIGLDDLFIYRKNTARTTMETEENHLSYAPARIAVLGLAFLFVVSSWIGLTVLKMPADYGQNNDNHRLTRFLEEKDLHYGYATFWYSQSVTVLSESDVKCREIIVSSASIYSDYYQSSRRWYTDIDEDNFFLIFNENEYTKVYSSAYFKNLKNTAVTLYSPEYDEDENFIEGSGVDGFVILVFDYNFLDK